MVSSQAPTPSQGSHETSITSEAETVVSADNEHVFPHAEVAQLARVYSQHSQHASNDPFAPVPESPLDPNSKNFNARKWAESMIQLQSRDSEAAPRRTAGVAFRDLNAYGVGSDVDFQHNVGNFWVSGLEAVKTLFGAGKSSRIDILQDCDGVVHPGELLVVLGPPGSGCSTFLKTLAGETHGFSLSDSTYINYQGIGAKQMQKDFRGEAIYTAEVDAHFANLTVGNTLTFAAHARAPRIVPGGATRSQYADMLVSVMGAIFGIGHTFNTKVGNDFIRGVSGGERKRVTIAEAALSGAPLSLWDNSTRGLDSANAIEFCKTLKMSASLAGTTSAVAIYQAPESAYKQFDKVLLLYKGRQIYFGKTSDAKKYFTDMGFECPDQATDPDFLTGLTSDLERRVAPGFEGKTPVTPEEFARVWRDSKEFHALRQQIDAFDARHPIGGDSLAAFQESRRAQQSKGKKVSSPYTLTFIEQILLCLRRSFWLLKGNPEVTLTQLFGNFAMALIIGSVFYNLEPTSASFFQRGALLFFAILMAAFASALEILSLYEQRPIVEKHARYALYRPSAEAVASMIGDLPYKISNSIIFSLTLYFMTFLKRTPAAFFFFWFISLSLTLCMSFLFRTIGASSRSLSQALAPAALLILALVIYSGFALTPTNMLGWARPWIPRLNPIAWGFESIMINEFVGTQYSCSSLIPSGPGYEAVGLANQVCTTIGSVNGQPFVEGERYINESFQYFAKNKWRNVGIVWSFAVFFLMTYMIASELVTAKKSKGEVLLFQRGRAPAFLSKGSSDDLEASKLRDPVGRVVSGSAKAGGDASMVPRQTAVFSWEDMVYDIKIKGEPRRILDHVDGWVKPGTLTALMGVSGAGKTTLLDVLATRVTMGVVTGKALVNGRPRDDSFQRKTGYVQQQDLHLSTSTVREALNFSALLRQPAHVSRAEKLAYVDEVLDLLDMTEYSEAVIGVPGEGLNVEQRKRLTIGVELAAKPQLLLFLDEPTSGLDSQTSWAICNLLEKLKNHGQAILCTIHQPSAMLFSRFDRLLFLLKGGRTAYYGPVGENSTTLISYFERNGADHCPADANPAEWMLAVVGAAPGSHTDIDWHSTWRGSPEYAEVKEELRRLESVGTEKSPQGETVETDNAALKEFAAPLTTQYLEVQRRVFEQMWRTPSYIWSKLGLVTGAALFIGFSFFKAPNSQTGLQNQMFAVFMLFTIFGNLLQQILPNFVVQRSLYEVRERPSKTYSWVVFMLTNIIAEMAWNSLCAVIIFFCWYFPIGLYRNALPTASEVERGGLMFLFVWEFLLFTSTFSHLIIAGMESDSTAANIANLMFSLTLIFCGVLASPSEFPRFWIFLYRVSPFTYLAEGMLVTAVANTNVVCATNELLNFPPPAGNTCGDYMATYITAVGGQGYLVDPTSTTNCSFCQLSSTNAFLSGISASYSNRWRDFGLLIVYITFNVFGALVLYKAVRMPKKQKLEKPKKE